MRFIFTTDGSGYKDIGKTLVSEPIGPYQARKIARENMVLARGTGAKVKTLQKGRKWRVTTSPVGGNMISSLQEKERKRNNYKINNPKTFLQKG